MLRILKFYFFRRISWFALSKAFCRSRKILQANVRESRAFLFFSVILIRAWFVEWTFLNPN